jgi:hypothetical protein
MCLLSVGSFLLAQDCMAPMAFESTLMLLFLLEGDFMAGEDDAETAICPAKSQDKDSRSRADEKETH